MLNGIKSRLREWFRDREMAMLLITVPIAALLVWLLVVFLAPLCIAILLAYLADFAVRRLRRAGLPRGAGIALTMTFGFLFVVVALLFGLPYFAAQLSVLADELPRAGEALSDLIVVINDKLPEDYRINQSAIAANIGAAMADAGGALLDGLLPHAAGFFSLLIYTVMIPLLVFFMLKDKALIFAWFARYLPRSSILSELYASIDEQFGSYIRGKLLEAALVGGASWAGFLALGLNYAFALAVLVGLSVLIPFVGAVAVTFPVLLAAYFQFGADARFVYLAAFYTVVQVLDGQILVPVLFSEVVKIHPVGLLTALLFFGGLWGFWGVFFAIPLAALLKSVLLVVEKHAAALGGA